MILEIELAWRNDKNSLKLKQDCSYQGKALNVPTAF